MELSDSSEEGEMETRLAVSVERLRGGQASRAELATGTIRCCTRVLHVCRYPYMYSVLLMHQFDAEVLPFRESTRRRGSLWQLRHLPCFGFISSFFIFLFSFLFFTFGSCIIGVSSRRQRCITCAVKHWTSAGALTTATRGEREEKIK